MRPRPSTFTRGALAALIAATACYDEGTPPARLESDCTPVTCEAAGAECGEVPDGCEGVLACGDCPQGETCGGGGPNACGTAACTPTTCEVLGAACGLVGDGCGAALECGGCPEGQTCGGGGAANQCGAPASEQGGTTRWVHAAGGRGNEHVAGVAVRDDGVTVALTVIGGTPERPDALGLVWLSPDGRSVGDRTYPVRGRIFLGPDPLATSRGGDLFLAFGAACEEEGCTELGPGPVTSGVLVKVSPEGDFVWRVDLPNGVASNVAADATGNVVVAESFANAGMTPVTVRKYRSDGTLAWSFPGAPEARAAVAFDPDGNVVVGQEWAVTKLDPNGVALWRRSLAPADAFITAIGAAAGGVVVAGSHGGPVSVDGVTAPGPEGGARGAFLVRFAAQDGAPAWARSSGLAELQRAGGIGADVDLAVHPDGWAALLVGRAGCDLRIERWGTDGAQAWSRGVDAPGCSQAAVFPSSIDVARAGDVRVGGGFLTPVDFGLGRVEPAGGRDGFVLDLAP
jgi:hypothetical protein